MGRKSQLTGELAEAICARLATGESLRSICRDEGMPAEATVRLWVIEDRDGFAAQYTRARDIGLDSLADEIVDISNTPQMGQKTVSKATGMEITEGDMIEHRRLQVEARKWYLSKLAPKRYGERLAVEHSGEIGIAERLREARERRKRSS